jgi:fermentation-respiration switch protein FrsA (DUF1100 family)
LRIAYRRLTLAIGVVVVLYVAYLFVLFVVQRSLLFPIRSDHTPPVTGSAEIIQLPTKAGPTPALYLAPLKPASGPAPLLLFTHGNAELASDWVTEFDEPREWGWSVLILEYPGYGGAPGEPSEHSITEVALGAYDWAKGDPRVDSTRIVAYGRSLGGGAAARLAPERPIAALILESSFTSVRAFAHQFLAPGFVVRDPFDNLDALRRYRGPLLVLHGRRDEIIPIAHGRALAAAVSGAEFHELPCGHNDCPRSWALIGAFLRDHGLMAPGP